MVGLCGSVCVCVCVFYGSLCVCVDALVFVCVRVRVCCMSDCVREGERDRKSVYFG